MGLGLSRTINKLSDLPRNKQASLYTRNRSFVPSGPGRNRYGQKESTFFTVPVENDDYRRDVSICIKTAKQRLATRSKSRGDGRIRSKFIIAHTKEEQLEAKQQAQREAQQQARQEAQEKRLALLAQLTASNRVLGPSSLQSGSVQEEARRRAHVPFSRPKRPDMGPMPKEGDGEEEEEEIGGRYRQPPPPLQSQDTLVPVPEIQQPQQGQQQPQQGQQQQQQQQGQQQQQQGPSQQRQTQPSQLREPVGEAPKNPQGLLGSMFKKPPTGGGQRRKTVSRRPVRASKRKNRK